VRVFLRSFVFGCVLYRVFARVFAFACFFGYVCVDACVFECVFAHIHPIFARVFVYTVYLRLFARVF
jgi:hypothetical protein